ncbi:hypothetical protein RV134_380040 [Roseovarius sp. EC-HK134]|nr:hypothetical protein RV420_460108 [Roseovarius sp. EC-SD190]VVT33276.1 hypothetical protein RV134_380040 [Roseovarius sp. EC-HK134]
MFRVLIFVALYQLHNLRGGFWLDIAKGFDYLINPNPKLCRIGHGVGPFVLMQLGRDSVKFATRFLAELTRRSALLHTLPLNKIHQGRLKRVKLSCCFLGDFWLRR